jgi:hypothetical protein
MNSCLHCYEKITMLATGAWVDRNGNAYCMKTGGLAATGEAVPSRILRHEPMPVIR